jgi:Ca2+-transporting ATPase
MEPVIDSWADLGVDPSRGHDAASAAESRRRFGSNRLTPLPVEPAWRKFLAKFDEPIIRILLAAALLKFVIDLYDSQHGGSAMLGTAALAFVLAVLVIGSVVHVLREWLPAAMFAAGAILAIVGFATIGSAVAEGLAVMIAVALATGVSFYSEHKSDREFEVLNARSAEHLVTVLRSGMPSSIPLEEVVVGDVVILDAGDEVPADGRVLLADALHIDQSLLTGESEPVTKEATTLFGPESSESPHCLFRGTTVSQGHGQMIVTAVGDTTHLGQLAQSLSNDSTGQRIRQRLLASHEVTPLQLKLQRLARLISRVGYVAAGAIFIAFVAADIYRGRLAWPFDGGTFQPEVFREGVSELLQAFVVMVVIIVVAVPEGLPMSVTVSLALAMRKMTRAKSLVRRMIACETIGSATIICTDKTGTLTQNRMKVERVGTLGDSATAEEWIARNAALNSTANLELRDGRDAILGNSTEGALLLWLRQRSLDHTIIRSSCAILCREPFSSETKRMTTLVSFAGQECSLIKGAPEVLLAETTHFTGPGGTAIPWNESARAQAQQFIAEATASAMRTLGFAHSEVHNGRTILVYDGQVAIRDPLRDEVPDALHKCQAAGIAVVMITGDNLGTARSIAADAGLLADETSLLWTSDDFNALSDEQAIAQLPRLRVLARAKPLDKLRLVKLLQAQGHVVAMTGDGTNDAPALKRADVGLAMGQSGTEVAKEAGDIILLDDSFATIVNAVHWGRALYENIQRFLQFQLTINVSALVIAFLGTILLGTQPPFTVLQMLWINVIMDTFAAVALCSEPPRPGLMKLPPKRRDDDILTPTMKRTILTTALFYIVVMLTLLLGMARHRWFADDGVASEIDPFTYRQATIFFTTYVLFQLWNLVNCRSLTPEMSGWTRIGRNRAFLGIAALILIGQILIVTYGGRIFNVSPLHWTDWALLLVATSTVLVFAEFARWWQRLRGAS